ncbi:MAG TPA: hypothetical protein VK084_03830 [Chitinophagaceae bacterium]|nr:hypothetical protein [Chitinophagaceae bacterium]
MRIYLSLTPNKKIIPFNYQHLLTGCLHKWIGKKNLIHGETSLYSFSWLKNINTNKTGINLTHSSTCFFSFHDDQLAKKVISGIMDDPALFCGAKVRGVDMRLTPEFSAEERFIASSPILIKRADENHKEKHFAFEETESNALMTQTLQTKLVG